MSRRAAGLLIYRVLHEQIEYLLLQTSYGNHHWTPPKGHTDPGETDEATALRETEEEAGLTESDLEVDRNFRRELNYAVKASPKVVIYWLARLRNPDKCVVRLSSEHQDFRWLPIDEACELVAYADMGMMMKEAEAYVRDKTMCV